MDQRYFIHDQETVSAMLATMQATGEHTGYNREAWMDPRSGQRWERYPMDEDEYGEDLFGLRWLPYPSIEALIQIAVTSEIMDEVSGASILMYDQEWERHVEFREALVMALEVLGEMLDAERFEIIERCTELTSTINRREILGKTHQQITADHEYFQSIGQRATRLQRLRPSGTT